MSKISLEGNSSGTGTLTIASQNTNNNYTLTIPNATTTLVGTDATQTLTNKSIVATQLTGTIAAARLPAGSVLQVVSTTTTLSFSTTSGSFQQVGLSASITPTSSSSKVFVIIHSVLDTQSSNIAIASKIFRGGTELDPNGGHYAASAGWLGTTHAITYLDSPATTSSTTYDLRARITAGAGTLSSGGVSTITLMEIAA